jgi:hypothetical protein
MPDLPNDEVTLRNSGRIAIRRVRYVRILLVLGAAAIAETLTEGVVPHPFSREAGKSDG